MKNENVERFFKTAYHRHRIYVLKELGMPKPWTDNPVFRDNYFCNVFRDFDKTSKWIIENVIEPTQKTSSWKYIFISRYISRIETLQTLKDEIDFPFCAMYEIKNELHEMKENKRKIVTNAFVCNSKVDSGYMDKINYIFFMLKKIEENLFDFDKWLSSPDMESVYTQLQKVPGIGPFMAYQYCVDLSYSERHLKHARDKRKWMAFGLGALRGMSRLIYDSPNHKTIPGKMNKAIELLQRWDQEVIKSLPYQAKKTTGIIKASHRPLPLDIEDRVMEKYNRFLNLTLSDVQHWLCEYDKYCRGGSKKRKYPGGADGN